MTTKNTSPAQTATRLVAKAIVELENTIVAREAAKQDWPYTDKTFEELFAAVTKAEEKLAVAIRSLIMVALATGRAAVDRQFREALNAN